MSDMQPQPALTCLKCGGAMRSYERSGVVIDQCTECRGVFLDRGELDRLVDAEGSRQVGARIERNDEALRYTRDQGPRDDGAQHHDDEDHSTLAQARSPRQGQPTRKRNTLLGDVLDIFGGGE